MSTFLYALRNALKRTNYFLISENKKYQNYFEVNFLKSLTCQGKALEETCSDLTQAVPFRLATSVRQLINLS